MAGEKGDLVTVYEAGRKAQFVRSRGEEFTSGSVLIKPGDELTPGRIGLLASVGIEKVMVYKKPRIALLATGDELVDRASDPAPGKIRDANSIMLTAAIGGAGAKVVYGRRVKDDPEVLEKKLAEAGKVADIVLLTGGVSVGPHDLVREIAGRAGFKKLFWRVRQKPGKPLFVAKRGKTLLFGLPGNPVSALNCYAYYVVPVLQHMRGASAGAVTIDGYLGGKAVNDIDRTVFLRVQVHWEKDGYRVLPLPKQGSHMLSSIDRADGFILLEPGTALRTGRRVPVHLYPWKSYEELYRSGLHKR
jgi:molybdopterin molybdotransferase